MREDIKECIELLKAGNVPAGYTKYRNEIISDQFDIKTLKELMDFQNGINAEKEKFGKGTKIISVTDILREEPIVYNSIKGEIDISEKQLDSYAVNYGDVLFQRSSENIQDAGTANVYLDKEKKATFGGFVIRGKRKKKYNPIVMNELLKMDYVRKQIRRMAAGAQHINVGQESLKKVWIALPDILLQESIEKIAYDCSRRQQLLEQMIEAKKENKKILAQLLLTGKKRLPGYEEIWEKVPIREICKERKEYSRKGKEYEHVSLTKEGIIPKNERYNREHLVKKEEKEYKITRLNDICYNPANLKFGVICRNTYGEAIFSPIYITLEINEKYSIDYISQYMTRRDFINSVRRYEEGTVYERMAVKVEDFLKYKVNIPQIEEQNAIARILMTADREIELLQKKMDLIKQERKALMQFLFSGAVCIKSDRKR